MFIIWYCRWWWWSFGSKMSQKSSDFPRSSWTRPESLYNLIFVIIFLVLYSIIILKNIWDGHMSKYIYVQYNWNIQYRYMHLFVYVHILCTQVLFAESEFEIRLFKVISQLSVQVVLQSSLWMNLDILFPFMKTAQRPI